MKVGLIVVLISYLGRSSATTPTPESFWPPAKAINAPRALLDAHYGSRIVDGEYHLSCRITLDPTPNAQNATINDQHCLWTHWYSNGRCYKIGSLVNNVYGSSRVRYEIKAKNGGKNCTGDGAQYLPCNELEYIATTFLTTVSAASPLEREVEGFLTEKQKPPGDDTVSKKEVTCVKPHVDANGNVRMAGKPCPLGGTKREVDVIDAGRRSDRVDRNTASTKSRDILFLIDESNSVGRSGFSSFLRLAKAVMNSLCGYIRMKKDLTRVGILTFDRNQHPQMNFDDYFERADMIDHIDTNINYTNESSRDTCLVEALSYTREEMLVKKRGARVGIAGTERMVILLTDGCTNCRNQGDLSTALLQMREQFSRDKVPIITFFVGSDSNCVKVMSGLADGSQCYQVFRAMDFDELDSISFAIEQNECVEAWEPGPSCPA